MEKDKAKKSGLSALPDHAKVNDENFNHESIKSTVKNGGKSEEFDRPNIDNKKNNPTSAKGNFTTPVILDGRSMTSDEIYDIAYYNRNVSIAPEALERVSKSRENFQKLANDNTPIYGVTTGFGEMIYVLVDKKEEVALQTNLVRSHSAGVGPCFTREQSRAIMSVRLNALVRGYSAVRKELVQQIELYINNDIIPVIPQIGSLGASGDLAPLSHIAVTLIGEGYVFGKNGDRTATKDVLKERNIKPLTLKFKEGLALINGTSAMTGIGALLVNEAKAQIQQAEIITVLCLEVLKASSSPFQPEGHDIARPHRGQIDCAANIRKLIEGSKLVLQHKTLRREMDKKRVENGTGDTGVYMQKAYTLRCIPQIVGAIRNTLYHVQEVLDVEINSSNDNPLFFEGKEVFHGGNFHGQPIAFVMDYLAIGLTQLGVVSERRTNRLLNRYLSSGLPEFLVSGQVGLKCGFAGAQYPATALVAENRTICSPASIQSVPSNGDNQDVVSMGLIAARNALRICKNNYYILAVELFSAVQAIDILGIKEQLSVSSKNIYETVRKYVDRVEDDRYMSDDLEKVAALIEDQVLLNSIKDIGIELV